MSQKPRPPRAVDHVFHPERDSSYEHFAAADVHPFIPRGTTVGRRNAWWLAEAALLSYWEAPEAVSRFGRAHLEATPFNERGVDGYIARGDGFAIVTFRGTQPDELSDIFDNAKFGLVDWEHSGATVHQGFRDALDRVWPVIHADLTTLAASHAIWFTGHSLGAALATLSASRFPETAGVSTIGSPRVGDHAFARAFSTRFGARAWRYVADTDVVAHVPPPLPLAYEHTGELRQIAPDGHIGTEPAPLAHFFNTLFEDAQHLRQVTTLLGTGAMTAAPKFLLDHMPSGYAVDIWNDYDANGD